MTLRAADEQKVRFVVLKRVSSKNGGGWQKLAYLDIPHFDSALTVRRQVSFVKEPSSREFQFDERYSEVSEAVYRDIFDFTHGGFTYDRFVDFAYADLVGLAAGSDAQKALVRELISDLSASRQKQQLLRLVSPSG